MNITNTNRQAHLLAAQSYASIRLSLEAQARTMLKAGRSLAETLQTVRMAGMQQDTEGET